MKWIERFRIKGSRSADELPTQPLALAWIDKGNLLEEAGALVQAMQCYDAAVQIAPKFARAHLSRGNILFATGNIPEALTAYSTALSLRPNYAAAHYNLGNAYLRLSHRTQALASYARAIELDPRFADAYVACGCVLEELNRLDEAEDCFHKALGVQPNYVEAHANLGNLQCAKGNFTAAAASHHKTVELKPDFSDGYRNLGVALEELGRFDEAIANFQRAVALNSQSADAHYSLGRALFADGNASDAIKHYRIAIELEPMHTIARWALAMAVFRPVIDSETEIDDSRAAFEAGIADLDAWFTPSRIAHGVQAVGSSQPFFLAYLAKDNVQHMVTYGKLCARIMGAVTRPRLEKPSIQAVQLRKLRIGIVSAQVRNHSVWNAITSGWVHHLDPTRFEVHLFHVGRYADTETERARREATEFIDTPRNLSDWERVIAETKPDVLIFPEIGMDKLTTQLASMRLAPVQAASWGHPHTTGLPTIDLFLSAELLEPEHGDAHYSEKLIRLPNLGVCVGPLAPNVVRPDLAAWGLPTDEPLLLCPGIVSKYSPKDDGYWVTLGQQLAAHGLGRLVFFAGPRSRPTQQFMGRLRRAFEQVGVDFDRTVTMLPTLPREQFFGLMQMATVMLDTIGFSGFNTALQSIECGLPVVAFEGEFMRGRLASALLRRMGLDEWVASSHAEYVEKVMQLVQDDAKASTLRMEILRRRAILFNDLEPVHALERILVENVERAGSQRSI